MTSDAVAKSTVLTRKQFMNEYGFSDSTERRGRTGGESWPPHIEIGPAGRVYYRRESVEAWLQGIESDEQQAQTAAPAADAPAPKVSLTVGDDTLAQTLARIIKTASSSEEARIRIAELLGGDHDDAA